MMVVTRENHFPTQITEQASQKYDRLVSLVKHLYGEIGHIIGLDIQIRYLKTMPIPVMPIPGIEGVNLFKQAIDDNLDILYQNLVLKLREIIGSPQKKDKESHNLAVAMHLLKQEDVQACLLQQARSWAGEYDALPHAGQELSKEKRLALDQQADRNEQDMRGRINALLNDYKRFWQEDPGQDQLGKLASHRHLIAHNEQNRPKEGEDYPLILNCFNKARDLVEGLHCTIPALPILDNKSRAEITIALRDWVDQGRHVMSSWNEEDQSRRAILQTYGEKANKLASAMKKQIDITKVHSEQLDQIVKEYTKKLEQLDRIAKEGTKKLERLDQIEKESTKERERNEQHRTKMHQKQQTYVDRWEELVEAQSKMLQKTLEIADMADRYKGLTKRRSHILDLLILKAQNYKEEMLKQLQPSGQSRIKIKNWLIFWKKPAEYSQLTRVCMKDLSEILKRCQKHEDMAGQLINMMITKVREAGRIPDMAKHYEDIAKAEQDIAKRYEDIAKAEQEYLSSLIEDANPHSKMEPAKDYKKPVLAKLQQMKEEKNTDNDKGG